MMTIIKLKPGEIPNGVEKYFLLQQNSECQLILERYQRHHKKDWDSEVIHEFCDLTPFGETEVLQRVKSMLPNVKTLYVEEGTFWDDID